MRKQLIALILGALAVGVIAGCGSSGSDSTASLSKAQFVKKADAICTTHGQNIERDFLVVAEKETGTASRAGIAKAIEAVMVPELRAEANELRALGTPSNDGEAANAVLDSFEAGINEIKRVSSANPGDIAPELEKANDMAKTFGFKICVTS